MAVFIAFLRAVNVGGTGKLTMDDLRDLCREQGFGSVQTYIQSGNVVFTSDLPAAKVKSGLEASLEEKLGKPVGVLLRTPDELEALLERNPFPDAAPNRVVVLFLDEAVEDGSLADLQIPGREVVEPRGREIFIHYPDGMGRSKLVVPHARIGTGRNLNTVRKVADLARTAAP